MPAAEKSVEINAPIEKVYEVVTDFEKYPEFLSEVKNVKVVKKSPKKPVVEFEVKYVKTFRYTLEFDLKKPTDVKWKLVEGDFRDNRGFWKLEKKGKNKTKATYSAELDFGFFVPKSILNKVISTGLPSMLQKFKERIESI